MDRLLTLSASRLAAMIRAREVSSLEVVDAHIERIQDVNGRINALVAQRYAKARREAREADEKPSEAPFHGVPCTIKESFAVAGMPNTSGLVARRGVKVDEDATGVARLRAAGAIVLGVTNVSELCMWMESSNRVYGRTNNPYDVRRIAGGSSGGEGSVVGSGGSPFGLGADIGGSIRMPAFFNGVFGHKPTGGLVPGTGQYPMAEGAALRYLTTGPLTRRAEDLYPLLRILAGPDGIDAGCTPFELRDPRDVDVRSLSVASIEEDGSTPVSADLRKAQARAFAHLERIGCKVRTLRVEKLRHAIEIWSAMMSEAAATPFGTLLGDGTPIAPLRELRRWSTGQSPYTLAAIGLSLLEKLPGLMEGRADRMRGLGRDLRAEILSEIGGGVILYPSYASPAPFHYMPLLPPIRWAYTAIWNVMEMPSTQVPLGLNDASVPLGVQVVAPHGRDDLSIAVALELERAFGGWVFPENL